jgi:hypothetical protein
VLCVDLYGQGDHPHDGTASLSGIALDAVFRYDLGRYQWADAGMMHLDVAFERGQLYFFVGFPEEERLAAVRQRPYETPVDGPMSVIGRLEEITVSGASVSNDGAAPAPAEVRIPASVAGLVYRYAWRKSEEVQLFSQAADAAGPFLKKVSSATSDGKTRVQISFAHGEAVREASDDGASEHVSFVLPGAAEDAPPAAECKKSAADGALACTGI